MKWIQKLDHGGRLLRETRKALRGGLKIIRTSRRIVYRLLAWNPWQPVFLRLMEQLRQPQRC
ncbi:MAG: hypothetical protein KJ000_06115 [Pirellulaceae bacterium]|nr:hypothetical protein [Pirellulaceae bacterium]